MDPNIVAIIPARYASVRLPCKPLLPLGGKPLIYRVYKAVAETGLFSKVIVATDSKQILEAVTNYGGDAVLTPVECYSGTDRVVTVIRNIDCDIVVNVQGDEPFIGFDELQALVKAFDDENVFLASLMHSIQDKHDLDSPNVVKVVVDNKGYALYFSRSLIPHNRDNDVNTTYFKHIGVYAFRKEALLEFPKFDVGILEMTEKLEQLRWLENGHRIKMVETEYDGFGIDTKDDMAKAERLLAKKDDGDLL